MLLALSEAAKVDIGLIATFGGIGLLVNAILGYIGVQAAGERSRNREDRERRPGSDATQEIETR